MNEKTISWIEMRHLKSLVLKGKKYDCINPRYTQPTGLLVQDIRENSKDLAEYDVLIGGATPKTRAIQSTNEVFKSLDKAPFTYDGIRIYKQLDDITGPNGTRLSGSYVDDNPYNEMIKGVAKKAYLNLGKNSRFSFKDFFPLKIGKKTVDANCDQIEEQALAHYFLVVNAINDALYTEKRGVGGIITRSDSWAHVNSVHGPYPDLALFLTQDKKVLEWIAENGGHDEGDFTELFIQASPNTFRHLKTFSTGDTDITLRLKNDTFRIDPKIYQENDRQYMDAQVKSLHF